MGRSILILSGRLAADPVSKVFEESQKLVSNATMFLDPFQMPRDRAAPIRVSAWEDMAHELCKYRKGHMLHVAAYVRPGSYKLDEGKTLSVPDAVIRAFLTENQVLDFKRAVYEQLETIDGIILDTYAPSDGPDEERISFTEGH